MRYPVYTNIAEQWRSQNFDVDADGNLYVIDVYNDRVLKFNDPMSAETTNGRGDTVADFVWGQPDFTTNGINRGRGPGQPDAQSLHVSFYQPSARGVSVDPDGNVWVADAGNNRVLRFPPDSQTANLVLGQGDGGFTASEGGFCWTEGPLDRMCMPTLARVHPETGDLYVVDENNVPSWFGVRILVFEPPFVSGQAANRVIRAQYDGTLEPSGEDYFFTATTLDFNPFDEGAYSDGEIWINEQAPGMRTLLLAGDGEVVSVIGARDMSEWGGDSAYNRYPGCGDIYEGYRLWWASGSLGFDDDDNIYLADEFFYRVTRYGLPYEPIPNGQGGTCLPDPNGGFLAPNPMPRSKFWETVGMVAYGDQIIVRDRDRALVWDDYMNAPMGAEADFTIPIRNFGHHAVDDAGRLWATNQWWRMTVYQLPITEEGQEPLVEWVDLYWKDTGELVEYEASGVAFDKVTKTLWVDDRHRVLRVSNYDEYDGRLEVDMVLGQRDRSTNMCNHDQEEGWIAPGAPTADSLCRVLDTRFDQFGNLFVIENNYECHGNNRVSVFMADDLQSASGMFPGISARKVFVRGSLTEEVSCDPNPPDEPRFPVSVAFNSRNHMVMGIDGYYVDENERAWRQLWFYEDPLEKDGQGQFIQGQLPDAYIKLPMGAAGELWFDEDDRLVVLDYTWARVWVIDLAELDSNGDPLWLVPLGDYESPFTIFVDGFEEGDCEEWSNVVGLSP